MRDFLAVAGYGDLLAALIRVLCMTLPLDVQGGIQGGLELSFRFGGGIAIFYGFRLSSE